MENTILMEYNLKNSQDKKDLAEFLKPLDVSRYSLSKMYKLLWLNGIETREVDGEGNLIYSSKKTGDKEIKTHITLSFEKNGNIVF